MQRDEALKEIYPTACQYFAVVSAFVNAGYKYKDGLTVEKVEEMVSGAVCKETFTSVIKEVFGIDTVYHEILKRISMANFKALVGSKPALLKFSQYNFWRDTLPQDEYHGVGYSNGGFFESYCGYHGEKWEDVRGANSKAEFTTNEGGYYFEVQD